MKRWTIAVAFDWKNSDDGMFNNNRPDETRYLLPEEARNRRDEVFIGKDDLTLSTTYESPEEAERDVMWFEDMQRRWWDGDGNAFPEKFTDEMPDTTPEFISIVGMEEVEVN